MRPCWRSGTVRPCCGWPSTLRARCSRVSRGWTRQAGHTIRP